MADSNVVAVSPDSFSSSAAERSKESGDGKKPKAKISHPPTSDMVNNAIKSLKERRGSSLQAIKKFITSNYIIDAEKLSPFIRKYLKSAVASGKLIQTKGQGASGSFKLSASSKGKSESAEKKSSAPKQPAGEKKPKAKKADSSQVEKKPKTKKSASSPAKKKPASKFGEKKKTNAKATKKSGSVKAAKSPKRNLTKLKTVAKKPKAPKPKKAAPAKKPLVAKKAATPKKK